MQYDLPFFSTCHYFPPPKFSIKFQGIISRGKRHLRCLQKSRLSVKFLRGVCMIFIGSIWVNKLSFASKKSDPLGCLQLMPYVTSTSEKAELESLGWAWRGRNSHIGFLGIFFDRKQLTLIKSES